MNNREFPIDKRGVFREMAHLHVCAMPLLSESGGNEAARNGYEELDSLKMIKALLKRGSDVNCENQIGTTPLVTAVLTAKPKLLTIIDCFANESKVRPIAIMVVGYLHKDIRIELQANRLLG